jgi:hypothetical protein
LRALIQNTLKSVKYEETKQISYLKNRGCNKENFKRIFNIYFSFENLRDKEILQLSIYTTLYVLWTRISKAEKDIFLEDSKNPRLCGNIENIPETFEALDLICKWVELNSLTENKKLPYILYDSQDEKDDESNMKLLPKINEKIQQINRILATFPQDINLMTLLYELIVMFHKLKDTTNMTDRHIIAIVYGSQYYRNIYSAILLFWKFIQTNVPNIEQHPKYPYIIMNMSVLEKTDEQNKLMNKITRSSVKKLKNIIPKKPENVNKLRNANLLKELSSY